VGYGNSWTAQVPSRIATVAAGYADGLLRAMFNNGKLWDDQTPCPIAGRVSMDMIGVDITGLNHDPQALDILSPYQTIQLHCSLLP
jgi:alanine racemase